MKNFIFIILIVFSSPLSLLCADNSGYKNSDLSSVSTIKLSSPPPPCSLPVTITKNLMTDFGAVGDGVTDDSQAFLNASDWINTSWSNSYAIKLYIPAGNYLVGMQLKRGESFNYGSGTISNPAGSAGQSYLGLDMLKLVGAKNVFIEGDPALTTKIIYKDKLVFGGVDNNGVFCTASTSTCPNACAWGIADIATVGIFLRLDECNCITVSNLWLEGHANTCILGGNAGDCNSKQIAYDGIVIFGGSDITIVNTVAANFGRDGLMTLYKNGNPTNITLTNFKSSCNGRQGFSFTSGNNIVATDCQFNLTGPVESGCVFGSSPVSGLDIEPESGGTCINSSFTRCSFGNNLHYGMISDNHYPNVANFTFDTCFFSGRDNIYGSGLAMYPNGMITTKFTRCVIVGQVTHVAGISAADHILFKGCFFTDWFGSMSWPTSCWNRYMLDLGATGPDNTFFTFDHCRFDVYHSKIISLSGNYPTYAQADRLFDSNVFNLYWNYMWIPAGVVAAPTPINATNGNYDLGQFSTSTLNSNIFFDQHPEIGKSPSWYWLGVRQSAADLIYKNTSNGLNQFLPNGLSIFGHMKYNKDVLSGHASFLGNW